MSDLFHKALMALQQEEKIVLATIVSSSGSTPVPTGAQMLLRHNGDERIGSVGGGKLEATVTTESLLLLAQGKDSATLKYDLGEAGADQGMICGGEIEVLVEVFGPSALALIKTICTLHTEGKPCLLIRICRSDGTVSERIAEQRTNDEALIGALAASLSRKTGISEQQVIEAVKRSMKNERGERIVGREGGIVIEMLMPPRRLVIFGAGHVGRHTSVIAAHAGFDVTIVDPRHSLARSENYPQSSRVVHNEYLQWLQCHELNIGDSAVIVTPKHDQDEAVLEAVLKTAAGYIGMIGSARKVDLCLRNLRARGMREVDLARVHAPIGLDIGAVTAEEIGVSIVAELIQYWRRAK